MFAYDLGRTVFNVPLVKGILTDEVVNSDLIPVILEWFSERRAQQRVDSGLALTGIDEPDIVLLMSFIDRDGWQRIKEVLLTPEMLTDWVSVTVDGFYEWIDSSDPLPQIIFNLESLIERVDSKHSINSVLIAFEYLDLCTQDQIDDFVARAKAAPEGSEVLYNLCEFPDPWYDDQFLDYVASFVDVVANVPKSFALTQELTQLEDRQGIGAEMVKQQLRTVRTASRFAWIAPLVLLVILLALRPAWSIGVRAGLPLLIGGGLTLVPPFLYQGLIKRVLSWGVLSEVPVVILNEASRALLRLLDVVFKPMLIQSIVIIVVGLLIVIISMIIKNKQKKTIGQPAVE